MKMAPNYCEAELVKMVKSKDTLLQALRLCTDRTAHKGIRRIALPFHDHGTRRGEGSASRPGRFLPRERSGTHCTGGWVGPRAGLDRCGKISPPPGFDTQTVQPPTECKVPVFKSNFYKRLIFTTDFQHAG